MYLTQNISNLLAAFGGSQAKAVTDSVLGNLQTKVWHANGDPETNQHAASVIGRSRQFFLDGNRQQGSVDWLGLFGLGETPPGSSGFSEQMEFDCDRSRFTTLRTGGRGNRWEVDAIVFQGGRRFAASGKSWLPVASRQQF